MNSSLKAKAVSPCLSGEIIDRMGGNAEVRRLCGVSSAAVSQWRRNGIPNARLQYLLELQKSQALSEQVARVKMLLSDARQ